MLVNVYGKNNNNNNDKNKQGDNKIMVRKAILRMEITIDKNKKQ